jgi:hypothetical protein
VRRPRRRAAPAKLRRLFARGWSVRLLARWYGWRLADVEEALRMQPRRTW